MDDKRKDKSGASGQSKVLWNAILSLGCAVYCSNVIIAGPAGASTPNTPPPHPWSDKSVTGSSSGTSGFVQALPPQ